MLNQLENHQDDKREFDDANTEKQHIKRSERYIPAKNWLSNFWKWTGFGNKTLWEILQLIGLPAVLAAVGLFINYSLEQSQKKIENDRYQQAALENYFQQMTNILVDKKLGALYHVHLDNQLPNYQDSFSQLIHQLNTIKEVDPALKESITKDLKELRESQMEELEAIARAQTLTTLNLLRLDTTRRDLLINFLRETTLAAKDPTCAQQDNKTTEQVEKCRKQEQEANLLIGINLHSLDLPNINLQLFILKLADLGDANLSKAFLSEADLSGSNLSGSNLSEAYMNKTDLRGANLRNANLTKASLIQANLGSQDTDLTNANLTNANLAQATPPSLKSQYARPELAEQDFPNTHLCNTTMPNGYISTRDCRKPWGKTY
jgi:uncharacterized protein YjbI with pentapeptide repeats